MKLTVGDYYLSITTDLCISFYSLPVSIYDTTNLFWYPKGRPGEVRLYNYLREL